MIIIWFYLNIRKYSYNHWNALLYYTAINLLHAYYESLWIVDIWLAMTVMKKICYINS